MEIKHRHGRRDQHRRTDREEHQRSSHDRRCQACPESVLDIAPSQVRQRHVCAPAQPVGKVRAPRTASAVHREKRRLQRRRSCNRHERDEEASDAHRPHERQRHEEQQREADGNGRAREDDCTPRGRHRPDDRVVLGASAGKLLTKAIDDEQRVVDRDPEADQLHEVGDVGRHRHVVRGDENDAERSCDRRCGEQERDRRCEGQPEHGEENRERDRHRDRLALRKVAAEDGVEVAFDRRLARHVCLHPLRHLQVRADVVRIPLGLGQVERRQNAAPDHAARRVSERRRLAGRNGLGRVADALLDPQAHPRGSVDDAVDDQKLPVAAVAEMLLEDRPSLLRVGPGNRECVREERGELRGRKTAGKQDNDPETENRPAEAQDETGPPGHDSTLAPRVP